MIPKNKKLTWTRLEKPGTIWKALLEKFWIWAMVFAVSVVYFTLPGWDLGQETYQVGDVASQDILLPESIAVVDEEATKVKKDEAQKLIKPVFDYNPLISTALIEKVSSFFSMSREQQLKEYQEYTELESLILSREVVDYFISNQFSIELENEIVSMISGLYRKPVVANKNFLMSLHQTGYVEQLITTGREREKYDVFSPKAYPEEVEEYLSQELHALRGYSRSGKEIIKSFLMANIRPNLTFNALQTQQYRQDAAARIETIVRSYPAGTLIARRGERIDKEDIQVLSVLQEKNLAGRHWTHRLGMLLWAALAILFYVTVVKLRKVILYGESPEMTISVTLIFSTIFLGLAKLLITFSFHLSLSSSTYPFDHRVLYYYAIPYALGAAIVHLISGYPLVVAFSLVFAHFSAIITGQYDTFFPYILAGSLATALSLHRLKSRSDVTRAGFILAVVNMLIVSFQALASNDYPDPKFLLFAILFAFSGGILTAVLVSFFTPIFETIFGVTTDLRLIELANATHPVLRQLALSAPGTYIHSFNMSLLSERAAERIHANPLTARVGCLFHDIGKIKQPMYFIENQHGPNPHQQLQPGISKMVLRNHILAGIEMAKENRLPQIVIDSIRQHHGTKLMHYFYEVAREKDSSATEDTDYRYPGPVPQTKETGIILLADAVEAAARSLEEPTPSKFENVVRAILDRSTKDGQLNECPLTMKELNEISRSFVETLNSMHHNRIAYPGFTFESRPNKEKEKQKNGNNHPEEKKIPESEESNHP